MLHKIFPVKFILIAFFLSCSTNQNSSNQSSDTTIANTDASQIQQEKPSSKEETQKWIVSKLIKYNKALNYHNASVTNGEDYKTESDYIPSISNDSIIVEYKTQLVNVSRASSDENFVEKCNVRAAVSIHDIDSVKIERFEGWNTPVFSIFAKRQSTITKKSCTSRGKYLNHEKIDYETDSSLNIVIGFDDKSEENIEAKLKEAFEKIKLN